MTGRRRRYKRGYPLAVLVGLEERRAVLWHVFSEVVLQDGTVERGGEAERSGLYDFHESIVNALRPTLKEGVKSIVIAAPAETDYAVHFLDHVRKHHAWLAREGPNAATFGELIGSAGQLHEVHELVKTKRFRDVMAETTSRDAESIVATLEKSLDSDDGGTVVWYSLEEIEDLVYGRHEQSGPSPEHVVLTDKYLAKTKNRGRILRLLQISKNIGVKTTIVNAETRAGLRLSQFGGRVLRQAKHKEEKMTAESVLEMERSRQVVSPAGGGLELSHIRAGILEMKPWCAHPENPSSFLLSSDSISECLVLAGVE